jgi:hypothetical protein
MQIHIYGHVQYRTIFREATFCGVPPCVFDKLGCAAGEKRLRNTDFNRTSVFFFMIFKFSPNKLTSA